MTFGGQDLYPSLPEKAATMGFSLVCNHPFVDGNKRLGHAAMETILVLNGLELAASADDQEHIIMRLAAGSLRREDFTAWVELHLQERPIGPGTAGDRSHE
jgi:death-on-curing protein